MKTFWGNSDGQPVGVLWIQAHDCDRKRYRLSTFQSSRTGGFSWTVFFIVWLIRAEHVTNFNFSALITGYAKDGIVRMELTLSFIRKCYALDIEEEVREHNENYWVILIKSMLIGYFWGFSKQAKTVAREIQVKLIFKLTINKISQNLTQ